MGSRTKIAWCDATFNPWRGCAKISAGCAHCYAEQQAKRNPAGNAQRGQLLTLDTTSADVEAFRWADRARSFWASFSKRFTTRRARHAHGLPCLTAAGKP
mgnify:CR=1 FL=1